MKKRTKGRDYSTMLIWSAAVVTVVRYAAAFIASDVGEITGWLSDVITVAMGISGLGMGILDVFGGAYLFDGWRRKMPASGRRWSFKFRVLTVFVFSLIGTGVLILVPFTVSRVTHSSLESVMGDGPMLFGWSFLVNIAPYLLIGGVSVGNQIVRIKEESSGENSENVSTPTQKVSRKFPNHWTRLSRADKAQIKSLSVDEIISMAGVHKKTAESWKEKVIAEGNGQMKELA